MSNTPGQPQQASTPVILELISYDRQHYERVDDVSLDELLKKINPERINWINIDGLFDTTITEKLQAHFNLHALLIDDVLNDQRPKTEEYDDCLYFTLKMLYSINGEHIEYEQISFVLGSHYLISF
jgi:magnesium transporter